MKKEIETVEHVISTQEKFLKSTFADKENAKNFIQEYLPEHITGKFDFQTLKIVNDSFVDKKLSHLFSDTLYEIKTLGKPVYIYIMFDHTGSEETFTGFQLIKYMVRIWESHLKTYKKYNSLPVIIPIVIYSGETPWKTDTHFISLFEHTQYLEEYIPNFNFIVKDIGHNSDEEIKGNPLLKMSLLTLKYLSSPDLKKKLPEIIKSILEQEDKPKAKLHMETLLNFLVTGTESITKKDLNDALSGLNNGDIMPTIAETWKEEGKKEGVLIGKDEERMEIVKKSLDLGLPIDTIEQITGMPGYEIRKIKPSAKSGTKPYASPDKYEKRDKYDKHDRYEKPDFKPRSGFDSKYDRSEPKYESKFKSKSGSKPWEKHKKDKEW